MILFALASFYCSYALSQEIDFQNSIDTSSEALITLDLKANDCLQALDSNDKPQATCNDFLSSLDGELISGYLEQCSLLKDWRDDYIDQSVASPPNADNGDNDEMLRRLIAIEYTCGENSLRSRTQFVVIAFNRLRSNSAISASPGLARQRSVASSMKIVLTHLRTGKENAFKMQCEVNKTEARGRAISSLTISQTN